jgi:hypothetical protein
VGKTNRGDISDCCGARILDRIACDWPRGAATYTVSLLQI